MFVTPKIAKIDTTGKLIIAFDIAMKKLDYYTELLRRLSQESSNSLEVIRGTIANKTYEINALLKKLAALALENGYTGLHIVCEPTGNYCHCLMRTARRLGHSTAWVSGENVHKARVIENNDSGKDDTKDPRVIYMLATMGKQLVYRELPPLYKQLRELNRMFDAADERRTQMKNELHHLLIRLFCDYEMSKDFLYSPSGVALMEIYHFSPYRIAEDSFEQFCRRMREKVPRIQQKSLTSIFQAATSSVQHLLCDEELMMLEQRLHFAFDDYWEVHNRRQSIRRQIEEAYQKLWDAGENVPYADGVVLTAFHLGRIIGETGPLGDFAHWRVLFKYGGVNLRTRQSGKYKGKLRLSKKGRVAGSPRRI